MKTQPSGTAADMYAKYFPGEKYTITFEPSVEQSAAMERMVASRATDGEESTMLLQMLGVLPSESAYNPNARDAWTRTPVRGPVKKAEQERRLLECAKGHPRAKHSVPDRLGRLYCMVCHDAEGDRRRAAARLRRAAA